MPDCFRHPRFLRRLLAVALCVGVLGAIQPVLFNDGSSMARYIAKQAQLEMVAEEEVEDYLEAVLYGKGEVKEPPAELAAESIRAASVDVLFGVDRWIAVAVGLAALVLLIPRLLERSPVRHLLPVISLWLVVESLGATLNGGKAHAELTLFAHAARWGMPLVLWGMVRKPIDPTASAVDRSSWGVHFAVVCTSLTFAVHGWESWNLHSSFQDLIHGFAGLFGWQSAPAVVTGHLKAIGVMDVFLAATTLVYRRPGLFLWMACWGGVTALSRPLTLGVEVWPEVAMRMANFALPLALYLIHSIPKPVYSEAQDGPPGEDERFAADPS